MSNTINGKATIFGADGPTLTGYVAIFEGQKFSQKSTIVETKDETGNDCQLAASNEHMEFDVEFKPSGASIAAAKASAVFVAPLAKVTISGITIGPQTVQGGVDRGYNGDWINMAECSLSTKNNDNATMTMRLRKYVNVAQNTSLTTPAVAS